MSKRAAVRQINEQSVFGENTGAGIIMIEANTREIGRIIHCNEEIEIVLGFKPKDIIGKSSSIIMPKPIGDVHNKFIERYFETAKSKIIDKQVILFA